jgi:ABC-type phosphate/phosphonate transport system substrate-binding protein
MWAARGDVPAKVRKQVQQTFLDLRPSDKHDALVLDALGADFYVLPELQFERLQHILDKLVRKKQ